MLPSPIEKRLFLIPMSKLHHHQHFQHLCQTWDCWPASPDHHHDAITAKLHWTPAAVVLPLAEVGLVAVGQHKTELLQKMRLAFSFLSLSLSLSSFPSGTGLFSLSLSFPIWPTLNSSAHRIEKNKKSDEGCVILRKNGKPRALSTWRQ